KDRQFSSGSREVVYYGVLVLLLGFFCGALLLEPGLRIKVTLFCMTLAFSLYFGELLLSGYEYVLRNWPAEITPYNTSARANVAKRFGVNFDRRNRLQVIQDMRKKGLDAVPAVGPEVALSQSSPAGGLLAENGTGSGPAILALSGIANKPTVLCNENG